MPRDARDRLRDGWVPAVPAVLGGVLAFRAGGFFPDATGFAAAALAVLLALRVTLAPRPFAGMGALLGVAIAALAALATWTLLSALWSHSPTRAVTEFDRTLLYLLVVVLAGSAARRPGSLAAALRWTAAAIGVVCVAALAARLLPGTFPTRTGQLNGRLGFPLTYWNALGVLSAVGVVLGTHLSASPEERPATRVAAAALLPVAAVTLYLTLSRGGIAAAAVGVVGYALLARPRALVSVALAAGPAVAVAVWRAYDASLLVTTRFASAPGAAEGHTVAIVVVLCVAGAALLRALALWLDVRLYRLRLPERTRRPVFAATAAIVVAAIVVAGAAADVPRRLSDARASFVHDQPVDTGDVRSRLTSISNNGRIPGWRVAWHAFERDPWKGTGAGTFALTWERDRTTPFKIVDAHSLYVESLSELGVPGLLLLLVALCALLAGGARALRGPQRYAAGAFLAAGVALLLHAGIDWDWEMPAVMAWLFGAGAVAAAAAARGPRAVARAEPARLTRVLAGLACLVLALTPAAVASSQVSLDRSARALVRDDCAEAVDSALASLHRLPVRGEPFEILGYCDIRGGRPLLAERAMEAGRQRDPGNWEFPYSLAIARGAAGHDPRPAARAALRLNPLGGQAQALVDSLRHARTPAQWRRIVLRASIPSA